MHDVALELEVCLRCVGGCMGVLVYSGRGERWREDGEERRQARNWLVGAGAEAGKGERGGGGGDCERANVFCG